MLTKESGNPQADNECYRPKPVIAASNRLGAPHPRTPARGVPTTVGQARGWVARWASGHDLENIPDIAWEHS
jgi:hypothetical protein